VVTLVLCVQVLVLLTSQRLYPRMQFVGSITCLKDVSGAASASTLTSVALPAVGKITQLADMRSLSKASRMPDELFSGQMLWVR
jgi:hypothetical protein